MKIRIELPWPPTLNHMYAKHGFAGKRVAVRLSPEARKFRNDAIILCRVANAMNLKLGGRLIVRMLACPPDARKRDLDNLPKAVLDAMTHAGVWVDDSQIDLQSIQRGPVVRGGQIIVTIRERACD